MIFTHREPQIHHNGCATRLDADRAHDRHCLEELEESVHRLGFRPRGFHFGARACSVGLEVLIKQPRELLRGGVVGGLVGPALTRAQDLPGHAGALSDNVETENRIALRLRPR